MRSRLILLFSSCKERFCEKNLRSATLLKKRLWHRCFPVNFLKFVRTYFCVSPWQLLNVIRSGMLLCGVPNQNSSTPILNSTRNRNSTRVAARPLSHPVF